MNRQTETQKKSQLTTLVDIHAFRLLFFQPRGHWLMDEHASNLVSPQYVFFHNSHLWTNSMIWRLPWLPWLCWGRNILDASLDKDTQGITKDVFEARAPCGVMDKVDKHQNCYVRIQVNCNDLRLLRSLGVPLIFFAARFGLKNWISANSWYSISGSATDTWLWALNTSTGLAEQMKHYVTKIETSKGRFFSDHIELDSQHFYSKKSSFGLAQSGTTPFRSFTVWQSTTRSRSTTNIRCFCSRA